MPKERKLRTRTGSLKKVSSSSTSSSGNTLNKKVENYKTRLKNVGINPDDVEDDRNVVEKALNLEKNQGLLGDIFEVINRPQNALFTGVNNTLQGESFGEGLKEGIKGTTKTTGKDILLNNTNLEDEKGKLNLVDVLGFGLDVVADPLDLALIPATGGGSLAVEAASKADDVKDATKALKAAKELGNVEDIAKATDALNIAKKAAAPTSSILYNGGKEFTSLSNIIGKGIGKGIKGTAKLADTSLEGALKGLDSAKLKKIEKVANKQGKTVDEVIDAVGKGTKLDTYRGIKKGISETLDSSKLFNGLMGRSRANKNNAQFSNILEKQARDDFVKNVTDVATKKGLNVDDVDKALTTIVEGNRDLNINTEKILKQLSASKGIDLGSELNAQTFAKALKDNGINANIVNGKMGAGRYIKLANGNATKELKNILNNENALDYFRKLNLGTLEMLPEEKSAIEAANKYIKDNGLDEIVEQAKGIYSKVNKAGETASGVALSNIAPREDFVSHTLSQDELANRAATGSYPSSNKAFKSQKYGSVEEANILRQQGLESAKTNELKGKLNREKTIYKYDEIIDEATGEKTINFLKDKNGSPILSDEYYKSKIKDLTSQKNSLEKQREAFNKAIETIKNGGDANIEGLSKSQISVIKKAQKSNSKVDKLLNTNIREINNPNVIDNITDAANSYEKAIKSGSEEALKIAEVKVDIANVRVEATKNKKLLNSVKDYNSTISKGEQVANELNKKSQNLETMNLLRQSAADIQDSLEASIRKTTTELENLQNLGYEGFKDNALKKIADHQEKIQLLESKEGKDFLETSFIKSLDNYIGKTEKQIATAKTFNDAIALGIFSDDYIKVGLTKDEAKGLKAIDGTYFANKLESFTGILPENTKTLRDLAKQYKGKTLYMDKRLATIFSVASNNNEAPNALVKLINSINNKFKKFSVMTPGFHIRNITGNATNMVMSGMDPSSIPTYWKKATEVLNSSENILSKVTDKGLDALTDAEKANWNILKQFYDGGFLKAGTSVQDLDDLRTAISNSGSVINKIANKGADWNESMDRLNRLSLLMYANDHPKYLNKLGFDNAVDAVKYVLFDPSNMSDFEKNVMKKFIPFYTFTKQNLMFQSTNILKNTSKYSKLYKTFRDMYNDLDEGSYYGYQKDSMQIPLPFTGSDGNQLFLKANLPVSDLAEYLENPLQRVVSSATPLIKLPYEKVTGVDTFTGQPLNKTAGKQLRINLNNTLGINLPESIDNYTSAAQTILDGFGLSNISTNLVKKVSKVLEKASGENVSQQELWAEIFRSVLQNTNQEKVQNSNLYNQYLFYQDYFKQLKDQGIDVPTINEINKSNKIKLNNLKTKRAKS